MAFAFIGESLASGILGKLAEAGYSAVEEKLLPAGDVEAEVERLKLALPQIEAVLCAVESDEIKNQNKALTQWVWQFRDAVECAEDVLDEMAYYEQEKKIQSQNQVSFSASLKRKFSMLVNGMFKSDDHGTARRIAVAIERLDKATSSVHNFLDLAKGSSRFPGKILEDKNIENDRETGSMITESVVFGREKERDSIIEWLTIGPLISDTNLSVFTIYGIGGLGKTTLAQLIYNDQRVRQFFDHIIWVCVSEQFNAVTIITKILEVMSKESPKHSLTALQDVLKDQLRSKRFLLVLDDVWNDENKYQWEKLVAPLKFGHGRILITTRMKSVADMVANVIDGKTDLLKLDGLEEKEFLMLFNKHAFHCKNPDEFTNLHPIGKQIVKKLGGCPLAAKIMGGVLNYSMKFEHWNKVLKEVVPDFHEGKDSLMVVLRLSYRHLPTYLQLCFRYCSIFPKDYEFKKNGLIKMWMGSGLIEPLRKGQMPEDVGRGYFNRLVRKSFFDVKLKYVPSLDGSKWKKFYVMHDLLHDLAQSVSEGECLRIDGSSSNIPRTIRHLSFNMRNLVDIRDISHLKCLRTLFIIIKGDNPAFDDIQIFGEVLKMLKSLRLLRISKCMLKLPDAIGELIHLRYLSFKSKELSWFPTSVYKLYHLEIIKFKTWGSLEGYDANGIVNLIKLRYLHVMPRFLGHIASIGKLTYLQELESFHIRPASGHTIMELRDLQSLRKLAISNLNMVSNPVERQMRPS